jgi:hypothetical protein
MGLTPLRKGGTLRVIGWARRPRKIDELYSILETTRDDELLALMTWHPVGAPIAWAEFGRRRFGVLFGLEPGSAMPIVFPPAFDTAS